VRVLTSPSEATQLLAGEVLVAPMTEPHEENPMTGYRGCFRYVCEPDLFRLELEILAKVAAETPNLRLMIPFEGETHARTWVPDMPTSTRSASDTDPIAAVRPVASAKSQAARTFGPIDPAGKCNWRNCSALACRIGTP
jgi:hypothetical protein